MTSNKNFLSDLITIQQAAFILNCHPNTLRNWDKTGQLKSIRVGKRGHRKYKKSEIEVFLKELNTTTSLSINDYSTYQAKEQLIQLQNIYKTAPIGLCFVDTNLKFIYLNDNLANLNSQKVKYYIGKKITEMFSEQNGKVIVDLFNETISKGTPLLNNEITLIYRHETKYFNTSFYPVKHLGYIMGVNAVIQDITPIKVAEQKLQYQLQLTRNIADTAAIGIFVNGRDGNLEFMNPEAEKMFGYSLDELKGKSLHEIVHYKYPDGRPFPISECPLGYVYENGQPVRNYEGVFFHKNGDPIWVICSNMPIWEDGKIVGDVMTLQNISERKELEQRKDDFISMASHELKTPITSIKALVQIIQKSQNIKAEKHNEYLTKINMQIDRLNELITDMLDISKIEKGKIEFKLQTFSFDNLVRDTIETIQQTTHTHTIELEGKTTKRITADKDRISQAIINLLTNAIKYSPSADKVIVKLTGDKDNLYLSVVDFGIGIQKKDQKRIFERFYRALGSAQYVFPGLGIGLYITNEIIKRHNGELTFMSTPGKGSTFTFRLPIKKQLLKKHSYIL